MKRPMKLLGFGLASGAMAFAMVEPGLAQDAKVTPEALQKETQYVFNTLLFLIGGFLVMWMAAGFAMLEAGMVRTKNVAMQCTKNIALYSVAGLAFWLVGYNLMYPGDGGWILSETSGRASSSRSSSAGSIHPRRRSRRRSSFRP